MTVDGKPGDGKPGDGKLVVLKFDGTFQQGFKVLLEIGDEGDRPTIELAGALPPNLEITAYLSEWRQHYHSLNASGLNSRIQPQQIIYGGSVNRLEDCRRAATELHQQMSRWLASESFRRLDLRLRESLSLHESIRVLLRTQDPLLRRLPWHLWDFIDRYARTEVALSAPVAERIEVKPLAEPSAGVKVLAVLGSSEEINVQADRQFLADLPDADISFLVEPSRQEIADRLWEQSWDILFFAGHSSTEGDRGLVCINPHESLSLEELRYGLKQAISKGLQLAIFNSCDGLGLAQSLESLHLPQIIVMREPVPDRVAQTFLKSLLAAFSSGQSLYLSVREAREQLQSMEDRFPCATWLPVIFQNSTHRPPTWQTLVNNREPAGLKPRLDFTAVESLLAADVAGRARKIAQRFVRKVRQGWIVLLISLLVTAGLISPFALTQLQPFELAVYDRMMQQRPDEGSDDRLLIIEITEADIAAQKENGEKLKRASISEQSYGQTFETSLSDSSLSRLLETLEQYQPRVVGLDLYRDFAVDSDYSELSSRLQQDPRLIAVCKAEDFEDPSIASIDPPPEVPIGRVGFSDFREDSDGILRRHLLGMLLPIRTQTSRCNTDWSFSLKIAAQYLSQQQIATQFTDPGDLKLNSQLIEVLKTRGSAYPPNASKGGSEILLNYRATSEIAPKVTLQQFLSQQPNPEYLKNAIVLIGVTDDEDEEDYWVTPIQPDAAIPGAVVQAHMVSQLVSAVLDKRPLITTLSPWQSVGWIGIWATVGGFLALGRSPRTQTSRFAYWTASSIAACAFLYGISFLSLLRGHWLPFVSLTLALVSSSVLMTIYLLIRSRVGRRSPSV